MGDGVFTAPFDGERPYEIEERVIAANPQLGYTCEELNEFLSKDKVYQKLWAEKIKLDNEPPVDREKMIDAKLAAMEAFNLYRNMKWRTTHRKEEMEQVRWMLYRRMRDMAMERASRDVQKIQAILGIENLVQREAGRKFRAKHSGRHASRHQAIVQSLQEPLESLVSKSTSESTPTPSCESSTGT
jgi:hypothetical protein